MKYLWKVNPLSDSFEFLEEAELPNSGYQSVYPVPTEEADRLAENGYAGYRGPSMATNTLWVDCDTDEAVSETLAVVSRLNLAYEYWDTGNRGAHIGIRRDFQEGVTNHPQVDKDWVKANIPSADHKLYTTLHLFRRPGTIHKKTGRRKKLLERVEGNVLILPPDHAKQSAPAYKPHPSGSVLMDPYVLALSMPQYDGTRHETLLPLAKRLAEAGKSFEFIHEWLLDVNNLGDPWPEDKIRSIAEWAFRNCSPYSKNVR